MMRHVKFCVVLLMLMAGLPSSAQEEDVDYTDVDIVGLMMRLDDVLQAEALLRELGYEFKFRTADESYFSIGHPSQGRFSSVWITSSMDTKRRLEKVRLFSGFDAKKLLASFKRIGYHIDSVSEEESKVYFRKDDFVATMQQDWTVPCIIMEFFF